MKKSMVKSTDWTTTATPAQETCRNSGYSPGANETQVLELKTHQTSLVGGFPEKYERLRIIKIGLKSFAVLKSRRKWECKQPKQNNSTGKPCWNWVSGNHSNPQDKHQEIAIENISLPLILEKLRRVCPSDLWKIVLHGFSTWTVHQ
jgi:hypothetical protein